MSFPTFTEFFHALWNYDPFPWQTELAKQVEAGQWPDYLAVPTGSGKTACIDIAIYALAVQAALPPEKRTIGRRIFFIVNRRVIVDEAFTRAKIIAEKLLENSEASPVIQSIADALRSLSPESKITAPPVDVVQLRGAIYRDNRWARNLTQTTVIASTIDQVGSRLLFRGYGLSSSARPLHAALVANDSLLLLDEAHISRPFAQTLERVRQYQSLNASKDSPAIARPFHFTQMTATPPTHSEEERKQIVDLSDADKQHPVLGRRIYAAKPSRLAIAEGVKGKKATDALARSLVEQAETILTETSPSSLAIMVNRVATARKVEELIRKKAGNADVSLMIGRMRPIDRDKTTTKVAQALKTGVGGDQSGDGEIANKPLRIIVATQCLEVGADLDFDALITECASLDALRQRFGRLNRDGRDIPATSVILMRGDLVETSAKKLAELETKGTPLDPIYGNSASHTWNWLQDIATNNEVDFGVESMSKRVAALDSETTEKLSSPTRDAPVLFPAYLDAWVQTNPQPTPDPDPALFIHGPGAGQSEIQICWRADVPAERMSESWLQAVSLCPPSTPETVNVPLGLFRDWFFQQPKHDDETSDLLNEALPPEEAPRRNQSLHPRATALNWRGLKDSQFVTSPAHLRPGDTVVLPVSAGGWELLAHIPTNTPPDPANLDEQNRPPLEELAAVDLAADAFRQTRAREILRLHPAFLPAVEKDDPLHALIDWAKDENASPGKAEIETILRDALESPSVTESFASQLRNLLTSNFRHFRYTHQTGVVLISRKRLNLSKTSLIPISDEDDALSANQREEPVFLSEHTSHVVEKLEKSLEHLSLSSVREALLAAARFHDWGKLDERFQALLIRGDLNTVGALPEPIAKSGTLFLTAIERTVARQRCGLPENFRHEMLSVQLAEAVVENGHPPKDAELILHLIASHHGHARPFVPITDDPAPPDVDSAKFNDVATPSFNSAERAARPPHRIDSGIAERFWTLTHRYGWWGLAYLEAALRLADQQASEEESRVEEASKNAEGQQTTGATIND